MFTPDEGRYAEIAREMAASKNIITPTLNGLPFLDKPILYYWLQSIAICLFGIKEWAIRLFPMLFGVIGAISTYCFGRMLYDRTTGLIASFILITSPLYYVSAHYANLDLEVAVLISLSLMFFMMGIHKKNSLGLLFFFISYSISALAILTKGLIGIAIPMMVVGIWMISLNQWREFKRIHLLKGLMLIAAMTLPWFVLVQKENPDFFHYFFITQHVKRFVSAEHFNNTSNIWFYGPVIVLGFFPWSIYLFHAIHHSIKDKENYKIAFFLLIWAGSIFIFFSIPKSKIATYILPLFPALSLLAARYLSSEIKNNLAFKKIHLFGYWILIFFIIAASLFGLHIGVSLLNEFFFYSFLLISLMILASVISFFLKNTFTNISFFIFCMGTNVIILICLILGADQLNNHSIKPLILFTKSLMTSKDSMIMFDEFYYDAPFYLQTQIPIVSDWSASDITKKDNWKRELWNGLQQSKKTDGMLLTESHFKKTWLTKQKIFVLLNQKEFDSFESQYKNFYYVTQYKDTLLLCNQAIKFF